MYSSWVFGPDATDEDVEAFTFTWDGICIAYTGEVFQHMDNATRRPLVAIAK